MANSENYPTADLLDMARYAMSEEEAKRAEKAEKEVSLFSATLFPSQNRINTLDCHTHTPWQEDENLHLNFFIAYFEIFHEI